MKMRLLCVWYLVLLLHLWLKLWFLAWFSVTFHLIIYARVMEPFDWKGFIRKPNILLRDGSESLFLSENKNHFLPLNEEWRECVEPCQTGVKDTAADSVPSSPLCLHVQKYMLSCQTSQYVIEMFVYKVKIVWGSSFMSCSTTVFIMTSKRS